MCTGKRSTRGRLGALWIVACVASPLGGCAADQSVELARAREALAQRDVQLSTLAWQLSGTQAALQQREAQLQQALEQTELVNAQLGKLAELVALNEQMAAQLARTEAALAKLGAGTDPATAEFDDEVGDRLEEVKALRKAAAERSEAYRDLLRQVQYLVDSGRVRAVVIKGGHVKFKEPLPIDGSDPYSVNSADEPADLDVEN